MKKIIGKRYYRIKFTLSSPLALSSGESIQTDRDVARDGSGKPYIPASSIAGVFRELFARENGEEKTNDYFGMVEVNKGQKADDAKDYFNQIESRIVFYDACIINEDYHVSIRDGIGLDENKNVIKGAKYDMEILETGASFVTYLEQDYYDEEDEDVSGKVAEYFKNGRISFGGKAMRGYGEISCDSVEEISFRFPDDANKWLEFDVFGEDGVWRHIELNSERTGEVSVRLKQRGGISIKKYTTEPSTSEFTNPDMKQLTIHDNNDKEGIPVIPGSSWAGAFRQRMRELGMDDETDKYVFGYVRGDGKDDKAKSRIRFNESKIENGSWLTLSRNAIDRFTGGAKDGALFTERGYYNGETELIIGWDERPDKSSTKNYDLDKARNCLASALADLNYGFLSIGGETSIGRGLFEIQSINGESVDGSDTAMLYNKLLKSIEEVIK